MFFCISESLPIYKSLCVLREEKGVIYLELIKYFLCEFKVVMQLLTIELITVVVIIHCYVRVSKSAKIRSPQNFLFAFSKLFNSQNNMREIHWCLIVYITKEISYT